MMMMLMMMMYYSMNMLFIYVTYINILYNYIINNCDYGGYDVKL